MNDTWHSRFASFLINLFGVILVINMFQMYYTSSVHCIVCFPSKVYLSSCIWPPLPSSTSPHSPSPLVLPYCGQWGIFVCSCVALFYTPCEWDHMVLVLFHLTSFIWEDTLRSIHVTANGNTLSLWLSSPLYICTTFLSIHPSEDTKVISMCWALLIMLQGTEWQYSFPNNCYQVFLVDTRLKGCWIKC